LAEIGAEMKFRQKTACPDMSTFFPNVVKKITDFKIWKGFGGGLEHPNILIFEHLNR
jgi:hypothetical protein